MAMPMSPSSPIRRTVSWGKRASRSIADATGRTSFSANSRAIAWIIRCSAVSSRFMAWLDDLFLQQLLELGRQERRHLEQVTDDPVVGDLEDRSLGVLVDGADHLGGPHPGEMLD